MFSNAILAAMLVGAIVIFQFASRNYNPSKENFQKVGIQLEIQLEEQQKDAYLNATLYNLLIYNLVL